MWQGQGRFAHVVGVEAELVAEEGEVVHVPRAQDDGVDVPRRAVREGGGAAAPRLAHDRFHLAEWRDAASEGDEHRRCMRHNRVSPWVLFVEEEGVQSVKLICDECLSLFEATDPDAVCEVLPYEEVC